MKMIKKEDLAASLGVAFDVFICSTSFEERSLTVAAGFGVRFASQTLVCIPDQHDPISTEITNRLLESVGDNCEIIDMRLSSPTTTADNIDMALFRMADVGRRATKVLLDITTFTHEELLIMYLLLKKVEQHKRLEVTYIYNSASDYSVDKKGRAKWLSRGVREVRSVLGYPGSPSFARPLTLIVLAGFETARAEAIIEAHSPNGILIGVGTSDAKTGINIYEQLNRGFAEDIRKLHANTEVFEFPLDDPRGVSRILAAYVERDSNSSVVIAPMNNKISTLGAAIAGRIDQRLQLCYASVESYNWRSYSRPTDNCFVFRLE